MNVVGNASTWFDQVPSNRQWATPGKNRVAVWAGGPGNFGHVLVIENVFDDGSILYSEANYNADGVLGPDDGQMKAATNEQSLKNRFGSSFTFKGYISA